MLDPFRTLRRDPHRLRTTLLGREHHRDLRTSFLLWGFCFSCPVSAGEAEFLDLANWDSDGLVRWHGMVSRHLRGSRRRPPRLSPRAFDGLPDSDRSLFPDRIDWSVMAGAGAQRGAAWIVCRLHSHPPCTRHLAGEALRRRDDGASFEGKRPLHRLLDLLHDGQHRWCPGPLFRLLVPSPSRGRECLPHCGAQCLRDVLCSHHLLPGTAQGWRRASAFDRDGGAELLRRGRQLPAGSAGIADRFAASRWIMDPSQLQRALVDLVRAPGPRARRSQPLHVVPGAFHRLLDRVLAAVHQSARLHSRLRQRECRRRDRSGDRWANRDLPHSRGELPDPQDPGVSSRHSGHGDHVSFVVNPRVSAHDLGRGQIIQAPRYYECISRLAPPGQQGTYMGFAFLPIGIGSLIGGWFGGTLMHHFGEVTHQPERIWWTVTAVGVATAALLWVYDRYFRVAAVSPQ